MDDDHAGEYTPLFGHGNNSYDLNSKIMLTAIISLSVVVAVVTILHVYARCVLTRQARRRAALRALSLSIAQARSGDIPKTGLDPATIAAIPVFKFKRRDAHRDDESAATSMECAICLSLLEDGEMGRMLPNCKHSFHMECIDIWLGSQSTCPVCRTEAKPWLVPEPREPPCSVAVAAVPTPPQDDESEGPPCSTDQGTSTGAPQNKTEFESSSRFNSIRRMLSRERSLSRRIQIEDGVQVQDLERQ